MLGAMRGQVNESHGVGGGSRGWFGDKSRLTLIDLHDRGFERYGPFRGPQALNDSCG